MLLNFNLDHGKVLCTSKSYKNLHCKFWNCVQQFSTDFDFDKELISIDKELLYLNFSYLRFELFLFTQHG